MQQDKSIFWFEKERKEQYEFAKQIEQLIYNERKNVICQADEKVGKREIMEILSVRTKDGGLGDIKVDYICMTALDRKDMITQIDELKSFNIEHYCLTREKRRRDLIQKIKRHKGPALMVLCLDESDFGTEHKQKAQEVYAAADENKFIRLLCFSATNDEAIFSEFGGKSETLYYKPHSNYRGFRHYLDRDLVHDADDFFTIENGHSQQALTLVENWNKTAKPISVLRLVKNYNDIIKNKSFQDLLWKYNIEIETVNKDNSFNWGTDYEPFIRRYNINKIRTLIVVNQTFTRGTELGFHEHIYFYHDKRASSTAINTIRQAFGRFPLYSNNSNIELPLLYGCKKSLQYACGLLPLDKVGRKLSDRILTNKRDSHDWETWFIPIDPETNDNDNVKKELLKLGEGFENSSPRIMSKENASRSNPSTVLTAPVGSKKTITINLNKKLEIFTTKGKCIISAGEYKISERPMFYDKAFQHTNQKEFAKAKEKYQNLTGDSNLENKVALYKLVNTTIANTSKTKNSMYNE